MNDDDDEGESEPLAVDEEDRTEEVTLLAEPVDPEPVATETELPKLANATEDDVTLMETLTESRVLEIEANRVVETVVEHQKLQQQSHYRFNLAKRTLIGSGDDSMTR